METSSTIPNSNTLNRLLELTKDLICICNEQLEIISVSNSILSVLGFKKHELIGQSFLDFVCIDDLSNVSNTLNKLDPINLDIKLKNGYSLKNEHGIFIKWSVSFDKNAKQFFLIGKELTKSDQNEGSIKYDDAINKALINGTNHLVWALDKNYHLTGFNEAFKATQEKEYQAKIEVGISTFDTMDFSDDVVLHWKTIYDQVLAGECYRFEYNTASIEKEPTKIKWHKIALDPIKINGDVIGIVGTSSDITELKNTANELADRNLLIEQVLAEIPMGVAVNDTTDGTPIFANSQFTEIYNWPADAIFDVPDFLKKIYPTEDIEAQKMLFKVSADIQSGDPKRMIWHNVAVKGQDNSTRYVNAKNIPLFEQNLMISTVTDNTETYLNKIALEKSYVEKKEILDGISDAFYSLDENFNFTFLNKHSLELLDKQADDLIGKNLFIAFPELKSTIFYEQLQKVRQTENSSKFEFYYGLFDAWFDERIYKTQIGYSVFFADITNKKQLSLKLEAAYDKQNEILESITDAFIGLDMHYRFTYVNQEAERVFNIGKEKLLGKNLRDVFAKAYHSEVFERLTHTLSANKPSAFEYYYPPSKKWFYLNCYPSNSGLSVYFRNITKAKKGELKLKKLNNSLKQMNEELEQFAFVASHDLQEPLRIISSFMDLLKRHLGHQLDETSEKYINYAIDGSDRMKQIIRDLLDYSRAGAEQETIEQINCTEIVDEIKGLLEDSIHSKGATLICTKLPVVSYNATALRQVLMNLISNALKYVEKGVKPIIRIDCKDQDDQYLFSISDNGIGIDEKYYEQIFTIFKRLHNRNQYSGTGIGLAICKKIVEKYDGTIAVQSSEGQGTTFSFTIRKNK